MAKGGSREGAGKPEGSQEGSGKPTSTDSQRLNDIAKHLEKNLK